MNPRRDFFRKLFVGAAALPAVVKVAMDEPLRGLRKNTVVLDEAQHSPNAEKYGIWVYRVDDNGIIWTVDQRPLRFTA